MMICLTTEWLFWWMVISSLLPGTDSSVCGRLDKIQMTVVSIKPGQSESTTNPLPHYECYLGAGDDDARVEARRAYITRYGSLNPSPTSVDDISDVPPNTAAHYVTLRTDDNNAFGGFYCEASKTGKQATSIMTIFMHSASYVTPIDGLSTQTLNIGDQDDIGMDFSSSPSSQMQWRINSSLTHANGLSGGHFILLRDGAKETDSGLYQFYRHTHRSTGQHCLKRLIVRSCEAGVWGPPGCTGICDNCYNGGICDDETGRCICAPGFMGVNCLTACGSNAFGYRCEFDCSSAGEDNACIGRQFCLLDPFGCRCNTGFQSLNCDQVCNLGRFGAGCLETCHCSSGSRCDRFTGVCESGACGEGWSGNNCQIPDICPVGYYGDICSEKCLCVDNVACNRTTGVCPNELCAPGSKLDPDTRECKECRDGYYGDSCMGECHCEADACDKVTGECVGCCKHQWAENLTPTCQTGLIESERSLVNPGQTPRILCTHIQAVGYRQDIGLSRSNETYEEVAVGAPEVTDSKPIGNGVMQYTYTFSAPDATPKTAYYCQLLNTVRTIVWAWLNTSYTVSVLPVLTTAPVQLFRNQTSITISWSAWDEETDAGDPSVVAYTPYFRRTPSGPWVNGSAVASNGTLQYTLHGLEEDTFHDFAVSAVREGPGGEGRRSDALTIKTTCHEPAVKPTDVTVTLTENNFLNVSWKIDTSGIECSTLSFTIYYMAAGSSDPSKSVTANGEERWVVVDDGLEPGQSYIVQVSLTIDDEFEGPRSAMSVIVTLPRKDDQSITPPDGQVLYIVLVIIAVLLVAFIVALALFCRKRRKRGAPLTAQMASAKDVSLDDESGNRDQDLEYISLDERAKQKAPSDYLDPKQGTAASRVEESDGDQRYINTGSDEYEVTGDGIIESSVSAAYEEVDARKRRRTLPVEPNAHVEESDGDLAYESPSDLQEYTGVYINEPTTGSRINPPSPMKVAEFQDFMDQDKQRLIEKIATEFTILPRGRVHSCSEAIHFEESIGRKTHILPYDHSRVKLSKDGRRTDCVYYNASYVKAHHRGEAFIAAQGPRGAVWATHFWRMAWQNNVKTIVMLNDHHDSPSQYWPTDVRSNDTFGDITVVLQGSTSYPAYTVRKMNILKDGEDKLLNVSQFHFHGWIQRGVPDDPSDLIDLIERITERQDSSKQVPLLVHCSDGSGLTGTFLAVYNLMRILRENSRISVFDVVRNLRADRMDMVQTRVQYLFIYQAVQEAQLIPMNSRLTIEEIHATREWNLKKKVDEEFAALTKLNSIMDRLAQTAGRHPANIYKNRFEDIIPLDKFRPVLKSKGVTRGSTDYVNATLIQTADRNIITTQSPLVSIVEDFWILVFDYECSTIVRMTGNDEDDETVAKYWPDAGTVSYGSMTVECSGTRGKDAYTVYELRVSRRSSEKCVAVNLMSFGGSTEDQNYISKMAEFVKSTRGQHATTSLIHCVNGVGLSAVYAVLDSQMHSIERDGTCDVFLAVRKLRKRNPQFVLTKTDYMICLQILKSYLNIREDYAEIN